MRGNCVMFECLLCGTRLDTTKGLSNHLYYKHSMSRETYNKQFSIGKDETLLTCPICGKYNLKQLNQHVIAIHQMSMETFTQLYPNQKLFIEQISERCARAGTISIANQKQNVAKWDKSRQKSWGTRVAKYGKDTLRGERTKESYQRVADILRVKFKDPDYVKFQSEKCKEQHKNGLTQIIMEKSGRKRFPTEINGKLYHFRSKWEISVAQHLWEKGIEFLYEDVGVPYTWEGRKTVYYPDFYLPTYNLILEVKPMDLTTDLRVQTKKMACEQMGYNFMFVTEEIVKHLNDWTLDV